MPLPRVRKRRPKNYALPGGLGSTRADPGSSNSNGTWERAEEARITGKTAALQPINEGAKNSNEPTRREGSAVLRRELGDPRAPPPHTPTAASSRPLRPPLASASSFRARSGMALSPVRVDEHRDRVLRGQEHGEAERPERGDHQEQRQVQPEVLHSGDLVGKLVQPARNAHEGILRARRQRWRGGVRGTTGQMVISRRERKVERERERQRETERERAGAGCEWALFPGPWLRSCGGGSSANHACRSVFVGGSFGRAS